MKQKIGLVVVRDENIQESVVIIIRKGKAHAAALMPGESRLLGNVLEGSVSPIAVKRIGEPLEIHRMAVHPKGSRRIAAKAIVVD